MKKTTFIFLLLTLCIVKMQDELNLFYTKPLSGVIIPTDIPKFNLKQWLDGSFQKATEKYIDETFGLRNFFIRFYNQIDYSFFKKPHSNVVIGKNDFLFQKDYIDEVTGDNFIGDEKMKLTVQNIRLLESYLYKKNIRLITVLAPGKSDFFKEHLPNYASNNISTERNYLSLLKFSTQEGIRLMDLNRWFLQIKDTSSYPLFPKQGIHWSFYGMALSADSIIKSIELEIKIRLPKISWTLELPDTLRDTDYDLGNLLNIQNKLPFYKMAYPNFSFNYDSVDYKPRLLVIGDSFYWTIFNERVFNRVFENETYYYYCNSIYPAERSISKSPYDLNILKEVEKYDIIILLQSSANYNNPGVGFVQLLNSEINRYHEFRLKARSLINEDQILLNRSKVVAMKNNIPLDSAITILCDSLAGERLDQLSKIKTQMRSSPEWMNQIHEKGWSKNMTVEQVMQMDAEWMIEQQSK